MVIIDKLGRVLGWTNDDADKEKVNVESEKDELQIQSPDMNVQSASPPPSGYVSGSNVVGVNFSSRSAVDGNEFVDSGKMVKSKITTIKPKDFKDAQTIANCLRDQVPVIINFEETGTDDAKRIIDFVSGTTYAINGVIKQVGHNVYVCAPSNVTVTYTEEKKSAKNFLD